MGSVPGGHSRGNGADAGGDDWDTVALDDAFVESAQLIEASAEERVRLRRRVELDRRMVEAMAAEEDALVDADRRRRRRRTLQITAAAVATATLTTAVAASFLAW